MPSRIHLKTPKRERHNPLLSKEGRGVVGRGSGANDTKLQTFDLFKRGKTIPEIAKLRDLAEGTIETHLAHFVWTGEINVEQVVPAEKIPAITDAIKLHGDSALSPLKLALGENYSYGEIKAVVNFWKKKNLA